MGGGWLQSELVGVELGGVDRGAIVGGREVGRLEVAAETRRGGVAALLKTKTVGHSARHYSTTAAQ